MRGFIAFTKKEIIEQLRTSKCMIFLAVFFLFGMMSPLLAKLMPDIFAGIEMQGIKMIIPEPTVIDAYSQFFKNLTQMGILILLLIVGGILSNELIKGTLINILAKGLPRHTVILSKYFAAVALWTLGYLLAAAVNVGYTEYLFQDTAVQNLGFSLFCLWLFGSFVIALILLSSTITAGNFGGLIVSALAIVVMLMIGLFPNTAKFNPITLASKNVALLSGEETVGGLLPAVLITCSLLVASILVSIMLFRKKKL